jgi:hypothetical protein
MNLTTLGRNLEHTVHRELKNTGRRNVIKKGETERTIPSGAEAYLAQTDNKAVTDTNSYYTNVKPMTKEMKAKVNKPLAEVVADFKKSKVNTAESARNNIIEISKATV